MYGFRFTVFLLKYQVKKHPDSHDLQQYRKIQLQFEGRKGMGQTYTHGAVNMLAPTIPTRNGTDKDPPPSLP